MNNSKTLHKNDIRRKIKTLKKFLTEEEKISAAEEVFNRLENCAAFLMADHVLMYHSLPDELSTISFLEKWNGKKQFYLPRVNGVDLDILPYDETRLELGSFHIEEPTGNETIDPASIELIIVPGIAYDRQGRRLGRGKGFYDRLLATTTATKIGIGYEFQLVEEIPTESHDVAMDIVITQKETIIIRKK